MGSITKNGHLSRNIILIGLLAVIFFVGRKIWRMEFPIHTENFKDIVLSMATANNVDIQQLIIWYTLYAVVLSLVFAYFVYRFGYYEKVINIIKNVDWRWNDNLFLGMVVLGMLHMGSRNWLSWSYILSMSVAYLYLLVDNIQVDKKRVVSTWIMGILIFSVPCFYIGAWAESKLILYTFNLASILYLCRHANEPNFFKYVHVKLFPLMLAAVVSYLILACMEISLLRGHSVIDMYALTPFFVALAYLCVSKKVLAINYERANFYGSLMLLTLSGLPVLGGSGPIDFFEGANHGLSIEEFILGMGLPIINNLDAHMLSYTLPGIIYYTLTGDYTGALCAPGAGTIAIGLGLLSLTYLFKHYFSYHEILIMFVLFPWIQMLFLFTGVIVFVAFRQWQKEDGLVQILLVLISFLALCVYRVDQGASFGIAMIVCVILDCLVSKKYFSLLKFIVVSAVFGTFICLLVYQWAISHNEDIILILQSILTAFSSNQHWGYGILGDRINVLWFYFLLPMVLAILMMPAISRIVRREGENKDWISVFLFVTFIFSIPRMLVRHNLLEVSVIAYAIPLVFTGLLLTLICKKQNVAVFSMAFLLGTAVITHNRDGGILGEHLLNTEAIIRSVHANEHSYIKVIDDDRVQILAYRDFFDANLNETETYFDFTNQSLFFAFTKRKNPIYINQCPGMINGYFGQKQAIVSLMRVKPKFVTMPFKSRGKNVVDYGLNFTLDGVLNFDRYYLITEYIMDNYRPYCTVGNFAVWCLKTEYDDLFKRDMEKGIIREYLDYTYEPEISHKHYLGAIPNLRGACNISNVDIKQLNKAVDGEYNLTNGGVLGQRGFITIEVDSPGSMDMVAILQGESVCPVEYHFKVQKGLHRYRLQVSCDILWYSEKLKTFKLSNQNVQIKNIYFENITADF